MEQPEIDCNDYMVVPNNDGTPMMVGNNIILQHNKTGAINSAPFKQVADHFGFVQSGADEFPEFVVNSTQPSCSKETMQTSKEIRQWTVDETKYMLHLYEQLIQLVGPLKRYRTKRVMWEDIACLVSKQFKSTLTGAQVENRYKNVLKIQKKRALRGNSLGTSKTAELFDTVRSDNTPGISIQNHTDAQDDREKPLNENWKPNNIDLDAVLPSREGTLSSKVSQRVLVIRNSAGLPTGFRCNANQHDDSIDTFDVCHYTQTSYSCSNFKRHFVTRHPVLARQLGLGEKQDKNAAAENLIETGYDDFPMEYIQPKINSDTPLNNSPVSCCVPGCINKRPEWVTRFPRAEALRACWISAIEAGTGQSLSDDSIRMDAVICNMHFLERRLPQSVSDEDMYREPSLFFSNNLVLQVLRCRLCLSYESVDNMFGMEGNFADGYSLRWMIKTYFGVSQSDKKVFGKGYICEKCAIRVDMTHKFWREIDDASKRHETVATEMMSAKVKFKYISSSWIQDAHRKWQEISPSILVDLCYDEEEDDEDEDTNESTKHSRVKVEPQFAESNLTASQDELARGYVLFGTNQLRNSTEGYLGESSETVQKGYHSAGNNVEATVRLMNATENPSHTNKPSVTIQGKDLKQKELSDSDVEKQLKFKCYLCNTVFVSKELRDRHLSNHQDGKDPHCCVECNLVFDQITSYNIHLSMHQQKLRYRGSLIGAGTNLAKFGQNRYRKVFSRKKLFECETCGKQFIDRIHLQQHRTKHTSSLLPNGMPYATRNGGESQNVATCNVCHTTFQHSKEIVTHFKEAHADIHLTTYPCKKCSQVFFTTRSASRHRFSHSKTYVCDQCGKGHISHKSLTKHFQVMHKCVLNETV